MIVVWRTLIVTLPLSVIGCDLRQVIVPEGEPVVVVQAVMRPDLDQQFVIVERSFTGTVDADFDLGPGIPDADGPVNPIEGAVVEVRNLDRPSDPCGTPVTFTPEPQAPLLFELPGVYWAPPSCPTLEPGDRLELTVQTIAGEVVTGFARVPGMVGASLSVGGVATAFDVGSVTNFNRDRDTLGVSVQPIVGRLLQLEVLRVGELNTFAGEDRFISTRIFSDSTSLSVPGDLIDVFERGDGQDVFRGGRQYVVTAALTDSNYFDFARSANNPFTGRGFINRLSGGVWVFGSLVATSTPLKVTAEINDPREGVYRLTGTINGVDVDVRLTVYLARDLETSEFSAFLDGSWLQLVDGVGVPLWVPLEVNGVSVDGVLTGEQFTALVRQIAFPGRPEIMELDLSGVRTAGGSFTISVTWIRSLITEVPIGELTVAQQ